MAAARRRGMGQPKPGRHPLVAAEFVAAESRTLDLLGGAGKLVLKVRTATTSLSIQSVRIQLLPRSKVLRREPSAATMSATSALRADTPTISAVVGDWIRCHRVPSVVSKIVPLRPTAQHSVFDVAWPASKSDRTPLSCFCQLLRSVERKIVPEFSSAQYTVWSGDETSTARTPTAPAGAGSGEVLAAKAGLAGEGLLAGALCSAAPTGDVALAGFEDVICACAEGLGKPAAGPRAGAATVVAV